MLEGGGGDGGGSRSAEVGLEMEMGKEEGSFVYARRKLGRGTRTKFGQGPSC